MTAKPLATKQFVRWNATNHFEERRIRYQDWVTLGAKPLDENAPVPDDTVWTQDNKWEVRRETIPLTDDQLDEFLRVEGKFSLVVK